MGISLLLFFGLLFNGQGSIEQISIAHITFCISYVAVVVRARAANLDPQLEEAARDLGSSAWGAFRFVTLPLLLPAIAAGAMLDVRALVRRPDHHVVQRGRRVVDAAALHLLEDPVRRDARDQRDLDDHRGGDRDPDLRWPGGWARCAATSGAAPPGSEPAVSPSGWRRRPRCAARRPSCGAPLAPFVVGLGRRRVVALADDALARDAVLRVPVGDHQVERLHRRLAGSSSGRRPSSATPSRAAGARTRASPGGW